MRTCILLLLPLVVACNGGDDAPGDTDVETDVDDTDALTPASLAGAWAVVEDEGVLVQLGLDGARHLDLGEDLSLGVYTANAAGQRSCPIGSWAPLGAGTLTLRGPNVWGGEQLLLLDQPDATTLVGTDRFGRRLTLQREAEVPAADRCGVATLADAVTVQGRLDGWSNLIFDGTALRLYAGDGTYVVDLTTGELSDPWTFGWDQYQLPLTYADGAPWLTCGCGNVSDLRHTQPCGTQLDAVATADVGGTMSVRAAFHDGSRLWLFGQDEADVTHLRSVDVAAEPDVLDADVPTALDGNALALLDGAVYLLGDRDVSRIDPTTGLAEATWALASDDPATRWIGLASDGESLWAISEGDYETDTSLLVRLVLE